MRKQDPQYRFLFLTFPLSQYFVQVVNDQQFNLFLRSLSINYFIILSRFHFDRIFSSTSDCTLQNVLFLMMIVLIRQATELAPVISKLFSTK